MSKLGRSKFKKFAAIAGKRDSVFNKSECLLNLNAGEATRESHSVRRLKKDVS